MIAYSFWLFSKIIQYSSESLIRSLMFNSYFDTNLNSGLTFVKLIKILISGYFLGTAHEEENMYKFN